MINHGNKNFTKTVGLRAVIFGLGVSEGMKALLTYRPTLLLNIADKPIITHILESLSKQGINTFDLILHHFPEQVEKKLENGSRWGIQINYHLVKDPISPLTAIIPAIKNWENCNILIGAGNTLPQIDDLFSPKTSLPVFYNYPDENWSGWALMSSESLKNLPANTPLKNLPHQFKIFTAKKVKPFFKARNYRELLESNKRFISLKKSEFLFPTPMKNVEPGVWISRAVIIEPGVRVIPPVLIGENTHIKSGACIGPDAIIENHCIIDNDSTVKNSLVFQNSYVGETLEINRCIIDRNLLINLSLGTQLHIKEEFIISESTPPAIHHFTQKLIERIIGLLLLVTLFPIYLLMKSLYPMKEMAKLLLPCDEDIERWTTFNLYTFYNPKSHKKKGVLIAYFSWLPMLINIIKGELSFIGSPARSIEETKLLPFEWRKLYLKTKPGLISLCGINHANNATEDEQYASESYYAAQMSMIFDIKIIIRWLSKQIWGNTHAS